MEIGARPIKRHETAWERKATGGGVLVAVAQLHIEKQLLSHLLLCLTSLPPNALAL